MKNQKNQDEGFTLVEIMIVVVIIGLLAAMAMPGFTKVRDASQNKAIMNNLRQVAGGADQYFMETGASQAVRTDLVGSDKFIKTLNPVAGENYADIFPILPGFTEISISKVSGGIVSF